MASTDLLLSSPTAGDRQKGTISVWVKRTAIETNGYLYSTWNTSAGGYSSGLLQFTGSTDQLVFTNYQANGGSHTELKTNRRFRDMNCWYNICVNWDTTLATSSDRYKIFINGVRETSFATATYPSQNENLFFDIGGANNPIRIGSVQGTSAYLDAVLSHYHKVDGTAYDASTFGETDSTTGEWKIKTSPSLTYGSGSGNFFIFKDGTNLSGSTVQDQSGEGNDLTVDGGTLTNTEDCPSNVFATLNPLAAHPSNTPIFYNGNTTSDAVDTSPQTISSTLAMPKKGKFYMEVKLAQEANSTSSIPNFGIMDAAALYKMRNKELTDTSNAWNSYGGRVNSNNIYVLNATSQTMSDTPDVGDIIGLAVDLDSAQNTLKYYLNGTLVATQNINNDEYVFAFSIKRDNADGKVECNFGNGYFATTQITSEGTNASGIGKFEYDVPSGYTALCTKGLNL